MSGDESVILASVVFAILLFILGKNEDGFVWWKALGVGVLAMALTFMTGYLAIFMGQAIGVAGPVLSLLILAALVAVSIRYIIKMKWKDSVTLGIVYVILGALIAFASNIHIA